MTGSSTSLLAGLVDDLRAETAQLVGLLSSLEDHVWQAPTPAAGWSVHDQVSHLAFFDDATMLSLRDPAGFHRLRDDLLRLGDRFPDVVADRHRGLATADCLSWFARSRGRLVDAYSGVDEGVRLPWFGPDMGPASSVTARLMETWAHGQDVFDAVGVARRPTSRLRHVADLGVRTLTFSFRLHGRHVPDVGVRVELQGPGGEQWEWGPADSVDRVQGTAADFCLVVTQRRHVDDTRLCVVGPVAREWMSLAQVFAGAIGPGRSAGQFLSRGGGVQ